jgi:hypothetical protein
LFYHKSGIPQRGKYDYVKEQERCNYKTFDIAVKKVLALVNIFGPHNFEV